MDSIYRFGSAAAVTAINQGDFSAFLRTIKDTNAKDPNRRAAGRTALLAALTCFADFLAESRLHGVRYTKSQPPTRADVAYAFATGNDHVSTTAQTLVNMVAALRRSAPHLRAIASREGDAPPAPAPLPVAVVAMPARQTVTDIERNAAGEIVASLQVERDF